MVRPRIDLAEQGQVTASPLLAETADLPNENPDEPETACDEREDHIE